jgi:hypothetical protein
VCLVPAPSQEGHNSAVVHTKSFVTFVTADTLLIVYKNALRMLPSRDQGCGRDLG